jgi:hypothetical protein
MIETRLDMQRAKRQSFARAKPDREEIAEPQAEMSPVVTGADDLPALIDANPIEA